MKFTTDEQKLMYCFRDYKIYIATQKRQLSICYTVDFEFMKPKHLFCMDIY